MNRKALDELKQQIPLLDYLQAHDWRPARRIRDERQMGLCPLHTDHKPSFLVDPHKNLFYCYGCGRGGDVIRFAELYHQVKFSEAVALLREWCGPAPLLDQVIDFYRVQLFRHHDAVSYLKSRTSQLGGHRSHADRLRTWSLFSGMAHRFGLSDLGAATSRPGQRCRQ